MQDRLDRVSRPSGNGREMASVRGSSDRCDPSGEAPGRLALTRRALCSVGLGVSAGAMFGLAGSPAHAAEAQDIRYVVTDRRYGQSLEFGAVLADRGARRLEVTDGLTRLWREALAPLWLGNVGAVAGLTLTATWACLAEQARSSGRKSVLVGHHVFADSDEATAHLLSAPRQVLNHAPLVERCGSAWPQAMAGLVAQCPTGAPRPVDGHGDPVVIASSSSLALTSWIIA